MTKLQPHSQDYIRLFEVAGMSPLMTTVFIRHYMPLRALAISRNGLWQTFMPRTMEQLTLQRGVGFLGDPKTVAKYEKEFKNYRQDTSVFFKKLFAKKILSLKEVEKAFEWIAKLWFFYQKTEFFYTDKAFERSKEDKTMAKNLKIIGEIKNSGRAFLNTLVFGEQSIFHRFLVQLSRQLRMETKTLYWLTKDEILGLLANKKAPVEMIPDRRRAYVILAKGKKLAEYRGRKAERFALEFFGEDRVDTITILKGTPANSGKAKGRARVWQYDVKTFDKASAFSKSMMKGDILVAETTSPEIILACKKAVAILTNQGGMLSHAAIVSREMGIPCIVGFGDITHRIKDGNLVEVDADKGIVRILKSSKTKIGSIPPSPNRLNKALFDNSSTAFTNPQKAG